MWGATAETVIPEPRTFDKGLVFVKDTDILLSGDKWTIVVNIALNDYDTLVYVMKTTLNQIRQKVKTRPGSTVIERPYGEFVSFDIYWEEIDRLDKMVQELSTDLQSFRKLLFDDKQFRNPNVGIRSKRGLMDLVGYGMKYLFGTADARDIKRLSSVCDELHSFKERMTHAIDHQLTYIKTLDENLKQSTVDIAELTGILRDSIRNFSLGLNRVEADLLDTQAAIVKQAKYSAAIREIEMAILELKLSIIQLQEALDVTSLGQLSSVLINPYNLSIILQQVSLQLPAGLLMLTGLTVQDMYVYYTIATVHAVATSKNIRLFVDIPLKAVDRYFQLYQVHSLPFFYEKIGKYVMIDEPFMYLAVAENRQFFAILTPYMLTKCTQGLYMVCPSDIVLKTASESNCLIALFLGKADIMFTECKRVIINETFAPIWIRSPDANYWIYSLSVPQRVTVQCQEIGSPPASGLTSQLILKGTGILSNSSSCYVYAENFKLLPHSLGKTTVTLNRAHIVLPIIDNLLKFSEEAVLQSGTTFSSMDFQRLDEISTRVASRIQMRGTEVTRMVSAIRSADVQPQFVSWTWFVGIIVTSVVIGALWPFWLKLGKHCYNYICTNVESRLVGLPIREPNMHGTELQVRQEMNPEGERMIGGTSSEAIPDTSSILTEFVRHGVVISDHL